MKKQFKEHQSYKINASAYLLRAKSLLEKNTLESLFYAAFELRCGIEARLQEYLEHYDHIPKKAKSDWNFDHLNKSIQKYLNTNNKIQRIVFIKNEKIVHVAYYVPLDPDLIKNGKKLGNYLHNMKSIKSSDDVFWKDFRSLLVITYYQLCLGCSGNLLAPGIKAGNLITTPLLKTSPDLGKLFKKGEVGTMKVDYISTEEYLSDHENKKLHIEI